MDIIFSQDPIIPKRRGEVVAKTVISDNNLSTDAIVKVTQTSQELLNTVDRSIYDNIQSYINEIYSSRYGELFTYTLFDIPLGNLIAAIAVFMLFLLLRRYLTVLTTNILLYFAQKSSTDIDEIIIREMRKPIRFLFIIIGLDLFFLLTFIDNGFTHLLLSSLLIIDLYWFFYATTPAIGKALYDLSRKNSHFSYELSAFIVRILRLLIISLAFITLLYNFGVNVTAFLASLGLGGLAFALAARDTAANIFGSIALMLDQSISVGEWIKVNGVEGTVEDIGMRTTKIRTFEKSLVTVPNSIVANSNIENFSRRGVRRIKMVIGLTYDTPATSVKAIVEDLERMLREHPGIAKDQTTLVKFDRFEDSYLGIFFYTFTNTSDWKSYLQIREDIHLKIMEIVEANGSSFAFPSQSLYLEKIPAGERGKDNLSSFD